LDLALGGGREDDRVAGGEVGRGAFDGDREVACEDGPELLAVEVVMAALGPRG
jgi:hypothetical protein